LSLKRIYLAPLCLFFSFEPEWVCEINRNRYYFLQKVALNFSLLVLLTETEPDIRCGLWSSPSHSGARSPTKQNIIDIGISLWFLKVRLV
jgi:hypothetical protein